MDSIYIETSVIGYLTSRPNRELIVAGHQQATRNWWDNHRGRFRLLISPAVLTEISAGDPVAAGERIAAVAGVESLVETAEAIELGALYHARLRLPPKARVDALHLAYAVAAKVDFVATWNMTHIANGETIRNLLKLNEELGRETPLVTTVETLMPYGSVP